jgi:molybdate transport system substrate-binding protein
MSGGGMFCPSNLFPGFGSPMSALVRIRPWNFILLMAVAATGCNRQARVPNANEPVVVFVAASTKDVVEEIVAAFKSEQGGDVKINADESSKLAMQIVEDAPAHVFLSANEKWADFVKEKGYAQETVPLLGNALVIVVPSGNPAGIRTADDLAKPALKRLAVAGPKVPAGIYARQALTKLNMWDALEAAKKPVNGDNVRVTLTFVERGECEAGIVYATDARITDKVDLVYTFPPETHDSIRYPLVLLKSGSESPSAHAFYNYLQSQKARELFAKHGFATFDKK